MNVAPRQPAGALKKTEQAEHELVDHGNVGPSPKLGLVLNQVTDDLHVHLQRRPPREWEADEYKSFFTKRSSDVTPSTFPVCELSTNCASTVKTWHQLCLQASLSGATLGDSSEKLFPIHLDFKLSSSTWRRLFELCDFRKSESQKNQETRPNSKKIRNKPEIWTFPLGDEF